MSKGTVDFDVATARQAAGAISRQAAKIPDMFEIKADDPKSEALPVIWSQFDDFTAKAEDLHGVAHDGLYPHHNPQGSTRRAGSDRRGLQVLPPDLSQIIIHNKRAE